VRRVLRVLVEWELAADHASEERTEVWLHDRSPKRLYSVCLSVCSKTPTIERGEQKLKLSKLSCSILPYYTPLKECHLDLLLLIRFPFSLTLTILSY
jgi:hypothetical protein